MWMFSHLTQGTHVNYVLFPAIHFLNEGTLWKSVKRQLLWEMITSEMAFILRRFISKTVWSNGLSHFQDRAYTVKETNMYPPCPRMETILVDLYLSTVIGQMSHNLWKLFIHFNPRNWWAFHFLHYCHDRK